MTWPKKIPGHGQLCPKTLLKMSDNVLLCSLGMYMKNWTATASTEILNFSTCLSLAEHRHCESDCKQHLLHGSMGLCWGSQEVCFSAARLLGEFPVDGLPRLLTPLARPPSSQQWLKWRMIGHFRQYLLEISYITQGAFQPHQCLPQGWGQLIIQPNYVLISSLDNISLAPPWPVKTMWVCAMELVPHVNQNLNTCLLKARWHIHC